MESSVADVFEESQACSFVANFAFNRKDWLTILGKCVRYRLSVRFVFKNSVKSKGGDQLNFGKFH
jgi:hypothetical protein